MKVMVPDCRVDWNFVLLPERGFRIPDLPIFNVVAVVHNVTADGNESGMLFVNSCDKGVAHGGIGGFSVGWIVETSITKSDETIGIRDRQLQSNMVRGGIVRSRF